MLRVRTKMRSDQYAAPRLDEDTGEGSQELRPPVHDERYGLPDIDVYTSDLKAVECGQVSRVLETTFFGWRGV
jgi:hypothetical protein